MRSFPFPQEGRVRRDGIAGYGWVPREPGTSSLAALLKSYDLTRASNRTQRRRTPFRILRDHGAGSRACDGASARGRQVEIESGNPLVQRHCTRCARDFVEDPASGVRHAVFVSVFSFRMLPDHINQQWLAEMCPGAPLPLDVEVRGKLIEHRIRKS